MLQEENGALIESTAGGPTEYVSGQYMLQNQNCLGHSWSYGPYPIYITRDSTAKAIAILKKLQDEKVLEIKSVPRFIELVDLITALV
jgi:hypothetical protein